MQVYSGRGSCVNVEIEPWGLQEGSACASQADRASDASSHPRPQLCSLCGHMCACNCSKYFLFTWIWAACAREPSAETPPSKPCRRCTTALAMAQARWIRSSWPASRTRGCGQCWPKWRCAAALALRRIQLGSSSWDSQPFQSWRQERMHDWMVTRALDGHACLQHITSCHVQPAACTLSRLPHVCT